MIRKRKIGIIAIVAFVTLGILGIVLPHRQSCDWHVCINCGIRNEVERRTIGGLPYLNKKSFYPTEISQAIGLGDCDHDWLRYRFVSTFGRGAIGGWLEHAQGRSDAGVIGVLLLDSRLGEEIAAFPNPTTVWRELILGIEEDAKLEASFSRWWEGGLERRPFDDWWSEHMGPDTNNDQAQSGSRER